MSGALSLDLPEPVLDEIAARAAERVAASREDSTAELIDKAIDLLSDVVRHRLLSPAGLCQLLGTSPKSRSTIWRWQRKGLIPAPIQTPVGPRWAADEVIAHMQIRKGD